MAPRRATTNQTPAAPCRIFVSQEEIAMGAIHLDNVEVGVEEFQSQGFVILENAVDPDSTEKLRKQLLIDSATAAEDVRDLGLNHGFNHGMEDTNFHILPVSDLLLIEEMWTSKHALAIMEQIIGPKPILCWAGSNIALPSNADARQAVHSDAYADIPRFPFCVEMSIYLQDTTSQNGATEIWPGTHVFTEDDHVPHGRGWINKRAFTQRARICPPIQPAIRQGSILLRDPRLWHSDMPNTSPDPRITMTFLYFPRWYRPDMRIFLPKSAWPIVNSWASVDLMSNTSYVGFPPNQLALRCAINFTQDPAKEMVAYRRAVDKRQGRVPNKRIAVTEDNYWTPSKHRTRAAVEKRKRQGQDDGDDEIARKKPEVKIRGVEIIEMKLEQKEASTRQKRWHWRKQATQAIEAIEAIDLFIHGSRKEPEVKIKHEVDTEERFNAGYKTEKQTEVDIREDEDMEKVFVIKHKAEKKPKAKRKPSEATLPKPVYKRSPLGLFSPLTNNDINTINHPPSLAANAKALSSPSTPTPPPPSQAVMEKDCNKRLSPPNSSRPPQSQYSPPLPSPSSRRVPPGLSLLGQDFSVDRGIGAGGEGESAKAGVDADMKNKE